MNTVADLSSLYEDTQTCAKMVGLSYVEQTEHGLQRKKRGKGFTFVDANGKTITAQAVKKRIEELVIPPAWQEVWICPDSKGHILVTGIDEKGRKQYIYHPKWRTMRDLIKFYRMIIFANALPKIRADIEKDLSRPKMDQQKIIGVMLWLLDSTYLRIGNEAYFAQNDSVGLTTLSKKNLVIAGPVVTLSFRGKSGKDHHITFEDKRVASVLQALAEQNQTRLFSYKNDGDYRSIESSDINGYLQEVTGEHVSAKDFRTWGGTLMAFNHFVENEKEASDKSIKPEKVVIEAIDAAANVLGNTRSVAKSSYVHPDILDSYLDKHFASYYRSVKQKRKHRGLDTRESELLEFLQILFEEEFTALKT